MKYLLKRCIVFLCFLHALFLLHSQQEDSSMKVGDYLPAYTLNNMLNYGNTRAEFADWKGKLLVLDFWSTHCASCIGSWPKLMDLQKEFKGKMQIVLINPVEDTVKVKNVFEKRKSITNLDVTLPTACGDRKLLSMFHVWGVPHIVWADAEGRIFSVTEGGSLNEKNIKAILNNEKIAMVQALGSDRVLPFEADKPIFLNDNGGGLEDPSRVVGQSFLTKGRELIFSTFAIECNPVYKYYFAIATGASITELYKLAYSDDDTRLHKSSLYPILDNRVVLKLNDSLKYVSYINGELQTDNLYNYQLLSPPRSLESMRKMAQADLKRYFGFDVRWVMQKRKCYILLADDTSLIAYRSGPESQRLDPFFMQLNKVPVSYFIETLEQATEFFKSPYPIVDETGYKGLLGNVDCRTEMGNPKMLNQALRKYKLHFELQERNIPILEISEANEKTAGR